MYTSEVVAIKLTVLPDSHNSNAPNDTEKTDDAEVTEDGDGVKNTTSDSELASGDCGRKVKRCASEEDYLILDPNVTCLKWL